ncbi:MAG: glucose-1-phosphate cytidylyltransferase [Dethiosulfovibrio peptidovorans]|nr:MAG: glucose-1-phosphate cytidylyltransferase [Dethiosulfovibrio peptidovorans]
MKTIILAGGLGTRLSEETVLKPKPMVEIGGSPILWHIMKLYSFFGFNDFVICLGYKGYIIKEYFVNYCMHMSNITVDLCRNKVEFHSNSAEPWRVTLVDTGEHTLTGGRVKRVREFVGNATFLLTYGDGVADIDIGALVKFHENHGKLATVTAVQAPGRFGSLDLQKSGSVRSFLEKPKGDGTWINGGFFVMEPEVFDYLEGDGTSLEREPLEHLARDNQLMAYCHSGFWQPMDTLREKNQLEELWISGKAPWRLWK